MEVDPTLPFEKSAQRRDFTINAIGLDPLTDELLDPTGGIHDIQTEHFVTLVLRSKKTHFVFLEHAVYCPLQLKTTFKTIRVCQSMSMEDLPLNDCLRNGKNFFSKEKI